MDEPKRIAILGKTGSGKSSLANTVFGEKQLEAKNSPKSETKKCRAETRSINRRSITLIDTPGFFHTDISDQDLKSKITKCITECAPGPHTFLILLKVEKYNEHERDVIKQIEALFSEETFKYATVVFTHGDQLQERQTIEEFVHEDKNLMKLVKKCGGRCHVIDNKYWKEKPMNEYRSNKFQVDQLLKTIDKMIEENKEPKRIVLLGKTGSGKSSLANAIFGETLFEVKTSPKSGTKECRAETRSVNGRSITLIDTPGFFNTDISDQDLKSKIAKCITKCAPGPHAFLILLKVEKYIEHERDVIKQIEALFSEETFKYATVVFTHGDQLKEGQTIKEFVSEEENLRELVKKCGDRCHVFDNRYWKEKPMNKYRSNKFQVEQLLKTIDKMIEENKEPKRIVLLGKTGSGKSSLANAIFGETLFEVNHTSKSGTKECQAETRSVNGRNITLIDTPGFFDTNISEEALKPEIIKCITECAPGPHAFLILLKVDKFSKLERAVIDKVEALFSEEAFKYATVVFTHGDQLQEGQTIDEFVREDENLSELVKKCGGRCHVIDNKYWKEKPMNEYRSNKFQVEQLLKTIDKMIEENKGGYYSNEMLQAVEEQIQREMEIIEKSSGNVSEEDIRRKAKDNVSTKFLTVFASVTVGVLVGALLGEPTMVMTTLRQRSLKQLSPEVLLEAAVGAVKGGTAGYAAAADAETPLEGAVMAAKAAFNAAKLSGP